MKNINSHFVVSLPLKKESVLKRISRIIHNPETMLSGVSCLGGIMAIIEFVTTSYQHAWFLIGGIMLLILSSGFICKKVFLIDGSENL